MACRFSPIYMTLFNFQICFITVRFGRTLFYIITFVTKLVPITAHAPDHSAAEPLVVAKTID